MEGLSRLARSRWASIACSVVVAMPAAAYAADNESLLTRTLDFVAATTALGVAAATDGLAALSAEIAKVDPALRETAVPMLARWIEQSRDAALHEGVAPIPDAIRAKLEGYVPSPALDRVRFRVGGGGVLSLQQTLFRSGLVPAVTLDHVVVFYRERDALDPALWAHELKHVMQYAEWGLDGFAARYVEDYTGVEEQATEFRRGWMDAMHRRRMVALGAGG